MYNIQTPQHGQEEFLKLKIHNERLTAQTIDEAQPPVTGAERLPSTFSCEK